MYFSKALVLFVLSAGLLDGALAAKGGTAKGGAVGAANAKGGASAAASAATSAAASSSTANANAGTSDASAAAADAAAKADGNGAGAANDTALAQTGDNSLTLQQSVVQSASDADGNPNITAGDAASETSPNNFINTCDGQTLTNGLQITAGSCNGVVMGDIPSSANMVATIITSPTTGDTIAANTDFTLEAQVANLNAGTFTNADTSYYAAPQRIGAGGNIIGHIHFTVQSIGSLNPSTPPDAGVFAFFKGVDNDGNGQGLLSAAVAGGLPAGTYRACTMSSSANHQPVLMPVAQRGAQDDCTKFVVSDSGASTASTASTAANDTADATADSAASATSTASTANAGDAANAASNSTAAATGGAATANTGKGKGAGAANAGANAATGANAAKTGAGAANAGTANAGANAAKTAAGAGAAKGATGGKAGKARRSFFA